MTTVISGAEAFFISGNKIGILLCHGFNGTPQSVEYLGKQFANAGFTVYAPRLRGHGTNAADMENFNHKDWIEDLETAFLQLKKTCHKIFVVGQSMGGALALDLAGKYMIDGIVCINAALRVPDLEPYKGLGAPRFIADETPDINDSTAQEITYSKVPLTAVHSLLSLMEHAKKGLKKVSCPVQLFVSPEDHVVPAQCSYEIYHMISSTVKQIMPLHRSFHVASLDFDKDLIAAASINFVKERSTGSLAS
ncbi:alpha/beta hydrolase [Peribacillus sp. SCS-155]|uniref:alpha/beta hydrolase n=1 Tax=Peribacillus sedimenti TaxID=3115297 RepID=UPI0039057F23